MIRTPADSSLKNCHFTMFLLVLTLVGAKASSAAIETTVFQDLPTPIKDLLIIKEMPDPLVMNNGEKVTTHEQWRTRRVEMIEILETYEYGHMPPAPGNVKATVVTPTKTITIGGPRGGQETTPPLQADYRMLHLTFGPQDSLGFNLGIFTPVTPADVNNPISEDTAPKPYPVLISLWFMANEHSLGPASAALARGYAVATINYQQLGADSPNYRSTAFFPAYPEYDWNDFSAWAWGISRAVDYLVTDPVIDKDKIMATGVSRLGQAVLLAGALDETHCPQCTGGWGDGLSLFRTGDGRRSGTGHHGNRQPEHLLVWTAFCRVQGSDRTASL